MLLVDDTSIDHDDNWLKGKQTPVVLMSFTAKTAFLQSEENNIFAENLTPPQQEQPRNERENGPESQPTSTEPPTSSPPFQRDPPRTPDKPQWNYPPPPVDIMGGGAAFWQNYSGQYT